MTGQFGSFDPFSKMNAAAAHAHVCENDGTEPDPASAEPTPGDGSAATELYRTRIGWSPFRSLGADLGPALPLSEELVPGVKLSGSATVSSGGYPTLDIWARGDDARLYTKYRNVAGGVFYGWGPWIDLGCCFDSDPAGFTWHPGHAILLARHTDGDIYVSVIPDPGLLPSVVWSGWTSIGKPETAAASAPAVASWGDGRADVFVRGGDDRLYHRTFEGVWNEGWTPLGDMEFEGKPAAVASGIERLHVAVTAKDGAVWLLSYDGGWAGVFEPLGGSTYPGSSPALASFGSGRLDVFLRSAGDSRLYQRTRTTEWGAWTELGGVLTGDPGAQATVNEHPHLSIVAPIVSAGVAGVWLKSWPYAAPCSVPESSAGCVSCGSR